MDNQQPCGPSATSDRPAARAGVGGVPIDYQEIGLICGLEVHQQLLTDRKLFCRCPAGLYTQEHDGTMLRHMRPTLSELGEYDGTALMEFKTRKNIVYLLHRKNVCTYEMDDTPPFLMNEKALDVAIEQCLMLGCDIVDEVHIARKQYLDGSIPTGFQRTAIIGVNGRLPFRGRMLGVRQVSVEEDSCREVSDRGHLIVWRTDRLGMPLIETVTEPELYTPQEVAEAILLIGRVCRSTGHVRVGLGASRQDVNVSVRGGTRVEIKGVPQAGWAPALVHGEAVRQVNLLRLRDELQRRGFTTPESISMQHLDVTALCADSTCDLLRGDRFARYCGQERRRVGFELLSGGFCVRAVRLRGLAGTLRWPTQPDRDFADEVAGRVRVIACLDREPVLLHAAGWPRYPGAAEELRVVQAAAGCEPDDELILVWGIEQDTCCAAEEIRLRYADATVGVPKETRQPRPDGTTRFERILPGPDRMYPDTDSPPRRIDAARVAGLAENLPEPPWVRERRYAAVGVSVPTIHYLIRRGGARLVDLVVERVGANLRDACFFFGERVKGLRRGGVPVDRLTDAQWCDLWRAMACAPPRADAWKMLVSHLAARPHRTVAEMVAELDLSPPPASWGETLQRQLAGRVPDHTTGCPEQRYRFLMGLAMNSLRGRVAARHVAAAVRAILGDDA